MKPLLKKSFVEERTEEISEGDNLKSKDYDSLFRTAHGAFDAIRELIPKNVKKEFDVLSDDFYYHMDKLHFYIEMQVYKQGLTDGFELAKILLPDIYDNISK